MDDLRGKKLLILAGAAVHVKVVEAAKSLGVYTITTDNLDDSPAKKISDEAWQYSIKDVDAIVAHCKKAEVDGVIAVCIDPAQRPYQEICDKLGLPCYGSDIQFFQMTDKHAFKQLCMASNVDVIPEYTMEDICNKKIVFPVFVKPVDSRGSRGQKTCYDYDELETAIQSARAESSNGDVIIEKYMGDCPEVQISYFFVDGEAYLIRTTDSYTGSKENNLDKVVACAVSPSQYTQEYLNSTHEKVVSMFKKIGIKNGPVFMQGFKDGDQFRFFDPGLRLPGVDYERIMNRVFGFDLMELFVRFALTGSLRTVELPKDCVWLKGNRAAVLFPTIKPGVISSISGMDEMAKDQSVVSCWTRYSVGDAVPLCYNLNQRFAEIDLLADDTLQLKTAIDRVYAAVTISDYEGNSMNYEYFDVDRIR